MICYLFIEEKSVAMQILPKNINGRAAAKNDDSHCEPM